jgi:hypothetical protein
MNAEILAAAPTAPDSLERGGSFFRGPYILVVVFGVCKLADAEGAGMTLALMRLPLHCAALLGKNSQFPCPDTTFDLRPKLATHEGFVRTWVATAQTLRFRGAFANGLGVLDANAVVCVDRGVTLGLCNATPGAAAKNIAIVTSRFPLKRVKRGGVQSQDCAEPTETPLR